MHLSGSAPAYTDNIVSYPARYDLSNRSFHHVMDIFFKLGKKMKFQTSKNFLNWVDDVIAFPLVKMSFPLRNGDIKISLNCFSTTLLWEFTFHLGTFFFLFKKNVFSFQCIYIKTASLSYICFFLSENVITSPNFPIQEIFLLLNFFFLLIWKRYS